MASEHELPPTIQERTLSRYQPSSLGAFYPSESDNFIGMSAQSMADDGILVVEDRFPMFVSATWRTAVLETRRCEKAQGEIVFTIDPGQVLNRIGGFRVRLLDASNHTPLKASLLSLYMRSYGATMGPGPVEDGVVQYTQLPPGTVELGLSCPDYERFTEIVDIQPGIVLDLGTRELARTVSCEVEVVDPAGKPLASIAFCQLDAATLTAARPTEPGGYVATDSAGVLRCRCGPSANWIVPHDSNWTAEPVLLDSGRRSRIVMQHGSELVSTVAATVPDDALLIVRDRNHRCLVIEQARPGFLVRSCLLPGSYEVELVNLSGTLLKKSIDLGEKPLVIDLAP
ncbi:MAG: hypothetical protein IPJ19_16505 [Planctomycetes bacterium]|nr:hypothetical protein [Planctomycetota bacterium]